jgi:catalase
MKSVLTIHETSSLCTCDASQSRVVVTTSRCRLTVEGLTIRLMTPAKKEAPNTPLVDDVIQAFDNVNGGIYPGFRPAHAKGILLAGTFTPSSEAGSLTRAPHIERPSTPVTIRFSDFAGVPAIPDNNPNASPRGIGIRFHLAEHAHTDIVAHSVDAFPTRTAEEFVEFLRAAAFSGPDAPHPNPIEVFLGGHPAALAFVQAPKPFPVSFATESFFSVSAYEFIGKDGVSRFGRYRVTPVAGSQHLDDTTAAAKSGGYLFDEIRERLAKSAVKMNISVQLGAAGDIVDDSTVQWPEDRPIVAFGTLELTSIVADNDTEQRQIIFDPIPRVDGIQPSADPLLVDRANVYLASGHRRRAAGPKYQYTK